MNPAEINSLSLLYVNAATQTEMLLKSLASVLEFHPELERRTVIVDNHTTNQAANIVLIRKRFPEARIIASDKNVGLARALNWGMYNCDQKYILYLNNDTYIEDGLSIPRMIAHLDEHLEIALLGPQLLNADKTVQRSCRMFYDVATILYRRTSLGRLFFGRHKVEKILMKDFDHQSIRAVDWVFGAASLIRREAIFDIGLFDERYPYYFEDMDLGRRLWEGGYQVVYYPLAKVVHYHQQESQSTRGWLLNLIVALLFDYRERYPFERQTGWIDRYTNKKARLHIVSGFKYVFKYARSDLDIRRSTLQAIEMDKYEKQKLKHQNV